MEKARAASKRTQLHFMVADPDDSTGPLVPEKSRAKQEFAKDCDIHVILAKYRGGQPISHLNTRSLQYGDFTTAPDYMGALDAIHQAQADFDRLPATTRHFFRNDPAELLQFTSDPDNQEEAYELGIAEKPDDPAAFPPPPQAVPEGDPPPPPAGDS